MQGFGSLRGQAVCVRDEAQKHSKKSAYVFPVCFNSKCTITPATKGFINAAVPVSAFSSKHHLDKSSFLAFLTSPHLPQMSAGLARTSLSLKQKLSHEVFSHKTYRKRLTVVTSLISLGARSNAKAALT